MSPPGEETSSPSTSQPMPENSPTPELMDPSALLIKVLSPVENFPSDLAFRVLPKSTVGELKNRISNALDFRPANDQQRLIYRGKMLTDELVVETILGLGLGKDGGAGETPQDAYTFHLVIRPSKDSLTGSSAAPSNPSSSFNLFSSNSPSPSPPPDATTTTTTSTVNPTPNSSIVTTTSITTSILPRNTNGVPSIPGAGDAPNFAAMSLDELRQTLRQRAQATEQEQSSPAAQQRLTEDLARMNEVLGQRITAARQSVNSHFDRTARSTGISIPGLGPTTPNSTRRTETTTTTTTVRYGSGGIPIPSTGIPTPVPSGSGTVASPSGGLARPPTSQRMDQFLNSQDEARRRALLAMQQEEAEQPPETANPTPTGPAQDPLAAFYLPTPAAPPSGNNLLGGNNLVYLLQDASGMPTALLVGPPGSAPPPAPVLPGPGIGFVAGGFGMPANGDFAGIPADLRALGWPVADNLNFGAHANNIFQNGNFQFQDPHARAGVNRNRNRPINIGEVLAGVRARATHFWLAVRLAVFVVLFTGSGGWRRMLYLGSIAVLIFIWQTGIFNEFFRPLAEAINPPPPNPPNPNPANPAPAAAPVAAAGPNPNPNPEPNQQQPTQQPLARDANGNPVDPAHTANMLVARREDRLRDMVRGVERGITIFLASLVPGLHERHVDAVEARQREAQQLRDAQDAASAEAGGAVPEGQGQGGEQVPQQQQQQGAGAGERAPVAEPEAIMGML